MSAETIGVRKETVGEARRNASVGRATAEERPISIMD